MEGHEGVCVRRGWEESLRLGTNAVVSLIVLSAGMQAVSPASQHIRSTGEYHHSHAYYTTGPQCHANVANISDRGLWRDDALSAQLFQPYGWH